LKYLPGLKVLLHILDYLQIERGCPQRAITPERLPALFLEAETIGFINRFSRAAHDLEQSLFDVKSRLLKEMEEIYEHVDKLDKTRNSGKSP
jgi:hypothetical protein